MPQLVPFIRPEPITPLVFEEVFSGNYNALIALSQKRRAISRNDASLATIRTYTMAWREFAKSHINNIGSSARSLLPLSFTWHSHMFAEIPPEDIESASPVLESVCSTLQLVYALTKDGAWTDARVELAYILKEILPVFVPREHDAEVFSPIFIRALDDVCVGQIRFNDAIGQIQQGMEASRVASTFHESAEQFSAAFSYLPSLDTLAIAHNTALAMAHRYAAAALVATGKDVHRGVAVALAQCAAEALPRNTALAQFATTLAEQNALEFGMQTVPKYVTLTRGGDAFSATETKSGEWVVNVP